MSLTLELNKTKSLKSPCDYNSIWFLFNNNGRGLIRSIGLETWIERKFASAIKVSFYKCNSLVFLTRANLRD